MLPGRMPLMMPTAILVFIAHEDCGSRQGCRHAEVGLIRVRHSVEMNRRIEDVEDEPERHEKA